MDLIRRSLSRLCLTLSIAQGPERYHNLRLALWEGKIVQLQESVLLSPTRPVNKDTFRISTDQKQANCRIKKSENFTIQISSKSFVLARSSLLVTWEDANGL